MGEQAGNPFELHQSLVALFHSQEVFESFSLFHPGKQWSVSFDFKPTQYRTAIV